MAHEESQNWYNYGWDMGYWPNDKHFQVADPHNQYSATFRQGIIDGSRTSKTALAKLARIHWLKCHGSMTGR